MQGVVQKQMEKAPISDRDSERFNLKKCPVFDFGCHRQDWGSCSKNLGCM